ncbi:MAG TPA: DUF3237 domain-containing protein [Methylomirabilota bacterium]|jgi:Protein of unknown function (DUF3237)|nr:DUF3237 domain-containing protein [Methylomirabilota bacterium]
MLSVQPLFQARVEVGEVLSLGRTPLGERRVIDILGGTFRGERMAGRVRPGGADWQVIGADGTAHLDARYTLETEAGALIQVRSQGVRHGPADVLARIAAGEAVDPSAYYFRTSLRFETSATPLDWLNRILAVAVGARRARAVELDVYEIR